MRFLMTVFGFFIRSCIFDGTRCASVHSFLLNTAVLSSVKRRKIHHGSCIAFLMHSNGSNQDDNRRLRCNTKLLFQSSAAFSTSPDDVDTKTRVQPQKELQEKNSSYKTTVAEVLVLVNHNHYNEQNINGTGDVLSNSTTDEVDTDRRTKRQEHHPTAVATTVQLHPTTYHTINKLVQERARARYEGNYTLADHFKSLIDEIPIQFISHNNRKQSTIYCESSHFSSLKDNVIASTATATTDLNTYPAILPFPSSSTPTVQNSADIRNSSLSFRIAITDISRKLGGGSTWSIICGIPIHTSNNTDNDHTVLSYAHRALGIAVSLSSRQRSPENNSKQTNHDLTNAIQNAKEQLQSWYSIHQQLYYNSNDDSGDSNCESESNIAGDTTRTASMTLDQLLTLISPSIDGVNDGESINRELYNWYCVETRLSGRTAADAAFWFAMSGVVDEELYQLLILVCQKELLRFGIRSSCRYKDIVDIVERLAAAGIRDIPELESIIDQCLRNKLLGKKDSKVEPPYLHLHSNHCSLLIWHFSTRQRKQRSFLQTAANHYNNDIVNFNQSDQVLDGHGYTDDNGDVSATSTSAACGTRIEIEPAAATTSSYKGTFHWEDFFTDPTRPLIIDIGCGMGISLLGLASIESNKNVSTTTSMQFPYDKCNFIGVDLSSLSINYASGVAKRWNLSNHLAFVTDEAENFLDRIIASNYPGPIQRVLVQFPTPYRLSSLFDVEDSNEENEDDSDPDSINNTNETPIKNVIRIGGNTQLPTSIRTGFMVTSELLQKIAQLLRKQKEYNNSLFSVANSLIPYMTPDMILQSNCEDVAVLMRNMAINDAGFVVHAELFESQKETSSIQEERIDKLLQPTQRTLNWIGAFNATSTSSSSSSFTTLMTPIERAQGYGWWNQPILPRTGRTETEVACTLKGTPVHRCILKVGQERT